MPFLTESILRYRTAVGFRALRQVIAVHVFAGKTFDLGTSVATRSISAMEYPSGFIQPSARSSMLFAYGIARGPMLRGCIAQMVTSQRFKTCGTVGNGQALPRGRGGCQEGARSCSLMRATKETPQDACILNCSWKHDALAGLWMN
jgi:hypothetical protein